jgi:hypothetical protein
MAITTIATKPPATLSTNPLSVSTRSSSSSASRFNLPRLLPDRDGSLAKRAIVEGDEDVREDNVVCRRISDDGEVKEKAWLEATARARTRREQQRIMVDRCQVQRKRRNGLKIAIRDPIEGGVHSWQNVSYLWICCLRHAQQNRKDDYSGMMMFACWASLLRDFASQKPIRRPTMTK